MTAEPHAVAFWLAMVAVACISAAKSLEAARLRRTRLLYEAQCKELWAMQQDLATEQARVAALAALAAQVAADDDEPKPRVTVH